MPYSADEIFRRAVASLQVGNASDAERYFRSFLAAQPKHLAGLNLFSILLIRLERFSEAEEYAKLALNEDATSDVTHYNYGLILNALNRPTEAFEQFNQALTINALAAETWNNRGVVLSSLKRYQEAIVDFDKAISIKSNYADAFCNKGKSLAELRLYDQSFSAYDGALALNKNLAEAWLGRGNIFTELDQYDEALASFNHALALKSDLAEAWLGKGAVFTEINRHKDAFAAFDKATKLKPNLKYAKGDRLHSKLLMCEWGNLGAEISNLMLEVRLKNTAIMPFVLLSVPSSPADQLKCAKQHIMEQRSIPQGRWSRRNYSHDRIRVAYQSSDYRDHPIGCLTAGLFEQHDKSRFETTAISIGPASNSVCRDRIKGAFEHFIDLKAEGDEKIAEIIRQREIDILVDLNGFTFGSRLNILKMRPAPIQVNYLGYPGTLGAEYYDYIVADQTLIPENEFDYYAEKVVWLPGSYQVNDNCRRIADLTPTRRDCGLPEAGFVFCCFNNTFKIMPGMFEIWMRLVGETEGSVLWLLEGNATAAENIRREAERRGIAAERVIFAPKIPLAEHLARHRQADLFLDTLPYNAHTTASDALWAGLPVLTCLGSTFAGRVAASLLKSAGLAEMITTSLEDYEALALKIVHDPSLLASLKRKLALGRATCQLFDTGRFARHIEAAYTIMWERQQRDEPPQSFTVQPMQ